MLRLDDQLCFLLYSASRQMTAAYRPFLTKLNLTYPQYLAMMVLWEHFGVGAESAEPCKEGIAVGELGVKLGLDTGTLTPLLKRLEKTGFVSRHRDTEDERVVRIYLTEQGQALQLDAAVMANNLRCASGLTELELIEIREGVKQLLGKVPAFGH